MDTIQTQPTSTLPADNFSSVVPSALPPGLQTLSAFNHILVKQLVENTHRGEFRCCETNNRYKIKDGNRHGDLLFMVKEDTGWCTRNCCGTNRPFDLEIQDLSGREVIRLVRPLACGSCLIPYCLQSIQVYSPPEVLVGTVEQEWDFWKQKFLVKDESGEVVLRIEGPWWTCACCSEVEFKILSLSGEKNVGIISKLWGGILKETFSDADAFRMKFPLNLDPKLKAVLLGALFLIDFMFFEHRQWKIGAYGGYS